MPSREQKEPAGKCRVAHFRVLRGLQPAGVMMLMMTFSVFAQASLYLLCRTEVSVKNVPRDWTWNLKLFKLFTLWPLRHLENFLL